MKNLEEFLEEWKSSYRNEVSLIPLFAPQGITWSESRKILFARLFYHARGHFDRFLWLMAISAPSEKYRSIVLDNIHDELGILRPGDIAHEALFFRFAEQLDSGIYEEASQETFYLVFLREFNKGHEKALRAASWVSKWALFSAYELLDEIDYKNIAYVAKHLGVTEEGMLFFNVHQDGDHYGKTSSQLLTLYDSEPETVEEAFRFISAHQLTMWQNMSEILASL